MNLRSPILLFGILFLVKAFAPPSVYERPDRIFYSVNLKVGPSRVSDVLDPFNAVWKSKGVESAQEISEHNLEAKSYFTSYFGLNYSNALYNSTTDVTTLRNAAGIPIAISIPYKMTPINETYRVQLDWPNNLDRKPGKTYRNNFGTLIQFVNTGTFASGNVTGQSFRPGDVIGYNVFYIFQECNHCSKGDKLLERMTAFSVTTSPNVANSQGIGEQIVKQLVRDENGRLGAELTIAQSYVDPIYGLLTVTSTQITFGPWIAPSSVAIKVNTY